MEEQVVPSSLLPVIRDLETILLRRLVVSMKKQKPNTAVDALITEARHQWAHWPQLEIPEIETELHDYLKRQLTTQLAEILLLRPKYLDSLRSYLREQGLAQGKIDKIVSACAEYGLQSRYYPPYMPDMNAMLEYTFRTLRQQKQPGARELIEAVNQKFFLELAKDPILGKQAGIIPDAAKFAGINVVEPTPGKLLCEVSKPKPPYENEYFIRLWRMQDIGKGTWRWEVTNYSVPLKDSQENTKDNLEGITTWFSPRYLTLEDVLVRQADEEDLKKYAELANIAVINEDELASLFCNINPEFGLSTDELQLISSFIEDLVQLDLEKITPLLTRVVKNITKPVQPKALRLWEQLIVIMLLRHCSSAYVQKILGHDLELDANQRLWLVSEEALQALVENNFEEASAAQDLPEWFKFSGLKIPKQSQVNVDDIHSYFDSSEVTINIEASKLNKELFLADLIV